MTGRPNSAPGAKRVGMNLLWLVPGVVGGSEEYTTRLLGALADRNPADLHYTLFLNTRFAEVYPELSERFETVVGPVSGAIKPWRVVAESTWLARSVRRHRIELMHFLGGILATVRPVPSILTMHDLQPLAMPEHFSPAKRWFSRLSIPRSVRAARQIVTLTEFTREDLQSRLGADPRRIVVVPPGFDEPTEEPGPDAIARTCRRHGIGDEPFILYPAITYPHKNHLTLVRAFARLAAERPDLHLVLPSGAAQNETAVRTAVRELGLGARVHRTGRIPAAELDALYRRASVLAFPSVSEGFGLPVLEAMSRGCPVVAADATALPEVVAGAGLLVPPRDPDAWAVALRSVLDDAELRARLVRGGRARAAAYRWETSAATLESLYRTGPPL